MRKADIANEIYKQVGISKNEAADIVELVLNMLKAVLQKGESVKIAGFGISWSEVKVHGRVAILEPVKKLGLRLAVW